MSNSFYLSIVEHYENCLRTYSGGPRAVDWKNEADARLRYDIMLDLIKERQTPATLLDFGCGLAALKEHMTTRDLSLLDYTGLEISSKFASAARAANPDTNVLCMDVLAHGVSLPKFDYIVMNGIFTRRHDVSIDDMERYLQKLLLVVFASCRVGLAFNVMSKAVDRESNVLFHPDPGSLLDFISKKLTRHFVLRNDYGLYESTFYLYRQPLGRHTDKEAFE